MSLVALPPDSAPDSADVPSFCPPFTRILVDSMIFFLHSASLGIGRGKGESDHEDSYCLASFCTMILLKMVRRNGRLDLNAVFYSFFVILRRIRSRSMGFVSII